MVLGEGIYYVSIAYHAQQMGMSTLVCEAKSSTVGLLVVFTINGFRCYSVVYIYFAIEPEVREILIV